MAAFLGGIGSTGKAALEVLTSFVLMAAAITLVSLHLSKRARSPASDQGALGGCVDRGRRCEGVTLGASRDDHFRPPLVAD
jgi:hypothetical protein